MLNNTANSSIGETKDALGEGIYQAFLGFILLAKELSYNKRVVSARELPSSSLLYESFYFFDIVEAGYTSVIIVGEKK